MAAITLQSMAGHKTSWSKILNRILNRIGVAEGATLRSLREIQ